jgi:hypothetical protein
LRRDHCDDSDSSAQVDRLGRHPPTPSRLSYGCIGLGLGFRCLDKGVRAGALRTLRLCGDRAAPEVRDKAAPEVRVFTKGML